MQTNIRVYVDFDGTISRQDTTDVLLERFADPAWLDIEAQWLRGEIGSRECMAHQVSFLRATHDELLDCVSGFEIDPEFAAFVKLCASRKLPLAVLSDGLDIVVEAVLRKAGLSLPIFANQVKWDESKGWSLSFPHMRTVCKSEAGNCKCAKLRSGSWHAGPTYSILIGDGRSDFCGAAMADVVFAKAKLAQHCEARGLPHIRFHEFADLNTQFARFLDANLNSPPLPAIEGGTPHVHPTATAGLMS